MPVQLLQWTAAMYLSAGLVAALGLALEVRRLERFALALLAFGAGLHLVSFPLLHSGEGVTPSLTDQSAAISFMACVGTWFFLALLRWTQLHRLVVLVAALAFLGAFQATLRSPVLATPGSEVAGSWPHAHVLLASAGLALLGLAGLAGLMFLVEHGRLKSKRPIDRRLPLPSLEALDRVNAVTLSVGFPLLTLGVITGMLWLQSAEATPWTGTAHQTWSVVAWAVYGVLVVARFVAHQGSRQAAASAVGGFAFLFFAVIGLEFVA